MTLSKYNEVMENVKVTQDMRARILENLEKADKSEGAKKVTTIESAKKKGKVVPFIRKYGAVAAMFAVILVGTYTFYTVHNSSKNMMSATGTMDTAAPAAQDSYEAAAESMMETEEAAVNEEAVDVLMVTESVADAMEQSESAQEPKMEVATAESASQESAKITEKAASHEELSGFSGSSIIGNDAVLGSDLFSSDVTEYKSAKKLALASRMSIRDIGSIKAKATDTSYLLFDNGMAQISYLADGSSYSFRMLPVSSKLEYEGPRSFGDSKVYTNITTKTLENGLEISLEGDDNGVNVALWNTKDAYYYLSSDMGMSDDDMMAIVREIMEKYDG